MFISCRMLKWCHKSWNASTVEKWDVRIYRAPQILVNNIWTLLSPKLPCAAKVVTCLLRKLRKQQEWPFPLIGYRGKQKTEEKYMQWRPQRKLFSALSKCINWIWTAGFDWTHIEWTRGSSFSWSEFSLIPIPHYFFSARKNRKMPRRPGKKKRLGVICYC